MKTQCPSCETSIELSTGLERKGVTCPKCGNEILVFDEDTLVSSPEKNGEAVQPGVGSAPPKIPGFKLIREIGRGGMGVVWEAVQLSLDRKVALKLLPAELASREDFVARFERESIALAKLSHPNIVSIIDRGKVGETYYFVMEYIEGENGGSPRNLGGLMQSGNLDSARTLRLIVHVCEALAYAHSQGIVHRDVKPANVLIDIHGNARVVDFGIANMSRVGASQTERLTLAGTAVGTPTYMAPEQTKDAANVDQRADIFSTGVTIYEMLTGQLPYGSFDPPSKLIPGLDPRWDAIVDKATRQSTDQRFSDMNDMLNALAEISDSQVTASVLSTVTPAWPTTPQALVAGKCPKCGAEVVAEKRFCTSCGTNLFVTCPNCGAEQPAWESFCSECGVDLARLLRAARYFENAKKHISLMNDPSAKPTERFEHCEKACIDLGRALKSKPDDEELTNLLEQTEKVMPALALEAADYALEHREFGLALQLCKVILEDDPQNEIIRARLEKIEKARAEMIGGAQTLKANGSFKQCIGTLSEAARIFPDDEEIGSLREEANTEYQRLTDTVATKIPTLRREHRYIELARVLQEMIQERLPVRRLKENLDNARKRIKLAERYETRAQDALDIGQYEDARNLAEKALHLVSDLPKARAILAEGSSAIAEADSSVQQVEPALSAGRWFTARALLRDIVRSQPKNKEMAKKLQAAEYHAFKQSNYLRLLLWTIVGGILWATAGLISALLCQALGEIIKDISLGGVTITQSDLQLAFKISLHSSFAVILLIMLVSVSRGKVIWDEIVLAFVALIIGPLALALPACMKSDFLRVSLGPDIQFKDFIAIVTGFALQGLVLSAVARSMFANVSPGLPFSWLMYGILGSSLTIYVQTWTAGTAQGGVVPFVSYAYLGLIIAVLLSAFLLTEGWRRYLFLPIISLSCYGVLKGAELTGIQSLRSLVGIPAACLFGAAAQVSSISGRRLLRRVLIAMACAAAWRYWPEFMSNELGNKALLIASVWVLWSAALRFHLRRWLEPGIDLRDLAQGMLLARKRRFLHDRLSSTI